MNSIGIMQGRLTVPNGRGIQFFPFENWKEEFRAAEKLGLDEIEFIFDYGNYESNPLFTSVGIREIREIIDATGVKVNSVCVDYFMRRPFYKLEDACVRKENIEIMTRLADAAREIGGKMLELPLVDSSSVKTDEERGKCIEFLREISAAADIMINLESDFPADVFKAFLEEISRDNISANYDSGNSSGLGYDLYEEVTVLGNAISNIHIKDRLFKGATAALGTGSADFKAFFKGLREIKYSGSLILQAARGEDGFEAETIQSQILFLKEYIKDYLTE